ncbi:uncharacterized protein LOC129918598 [Episyrphus balteatus]|uniref:uncharacterized protein LOC129918598 n=1 Tax=Episyrphus balteatus TaxID=286459 RepID=UPI0024850FFD|nr:uncharacterized protein LOC129918598 [Episyrphus balteatus]
MSTVRSDQLFLDGENYQQRTMPNKQFHSERKHNIRKHALGEIKNVIHNHASVTPFKGHQIPGPSKNICTDLFKKHSQHLKSQFDGEQQIKIQPIVTAKTEELYKEDLPTPRKCNKNCHKGLEEIWSEMNVLEPDVLERLINGNGEIEDDFDLPDRNIPPPTIDFDDLEFDLEFDVQDPYEMENKKLLEKILAEDQARTEFPLANEWIDSL